MATVGLSGGKLFLIVMILVVKYSEKACGVSESKEDGRGVEFFLPRMALKLWNSSLHELLLCILKENVQLFTKLKNTQNKSEIGLDTQDYRYKRYIKKNESYK